MNKSSRRVLRTTAAVLGMTALGAVGSGTAFADTVSGLDGSTNGYGATDNAPANDSAGLPTDELGTPDLHSFQMPSLGDQSVKSTRSSDSDSGDSDSSSSDDSESGSKAKSKSKSTDKVKSSSSSDDSSSDDSSSDDSSDSSSKHSSAGLLGGLI